LPAPLPCLACRRSALLGLPCLAASLKTEAMTPRRTEEEQERLAAALRANLARRKAQARERQESDLRQRQGGDPGQRQEDDASEPQEPHQSRPSEDPPEPSGSGGADPPGEESHDSAGFVGDKP
jgi:hypothetical protein